MSQVSPKWCGPYYGSDTSFQDLEILTVQHIPAKIRKGEAELMQTKWFDYRQMHPMLATLYFMECYKVAYRDFTRAAVNADTADFVKPIKGDSFLEAREKLSFWRLRQLVDGLGIRYDFFLAEAMRWYVTECFRRESLYPPRPGHIATNEDLLTTVMIAWDEEKATRLQFAQDETFKTANFDGSDHQVAYEKFVIEQIQNRQHKRFALSSYIYTHDMLRVEVAIKHFGADLVNDALREFNIP